MSDYDSWQWVNKGYNENDIFSLNIGFTIQGKLNPKYFAKLTEKIINKETFFVNLEEYKARKVGYDALIKQREHCKKIINDFGDLTWTLGGHKTCVLFSQEKFSSKSFRSLEKTDVQHGVVFCRKPTGDWTISAYNVSDDIDFNLGKYLFERWGGGGHKGAAGCTLSQEQFINVLINKQL